MSDQPLTPLSRHDLQWCIRMLPKKVLELMQARPGQVFLAGGFIRAAIAHEPINDVDLFVPSKDAAAACALALKGNNEHIRLIETENAWTVVMKPYPVQIIHRWTFNDPAACIQSFDFTIARAAIWHEGPNAGQWASACDPQFYPDLAAKRLVYCKPERIEEAGGSMLRVLKFYQRGYRIPLDSLGAVIARLCQAVDWNKIDRHNNVEGQLGKVLTGLLREVDPNIDPLHESHLPSDAQEEDSQ